MVAHAGPASDANGCPVESGLARAVEAISTPARPNKLLRAWVRFTQKVLNCLKR